MKIFNATALVLAACAVSWCVKKSQDAQKDLRQSVKKPQDSQKDARQREEVRVYNIARDSTQSLDSRFEAASHLTEAQKKRLQIELLKKIPEHMDMKTTEAVLLLGKIGDRAAAERLERLHENYPGDFSGKFNTARWHAIDEIRARTGIEKRDVNLF